VIQNNLDFNTSTSSLWCASNGIPVAITNVLVGSLGDYGPVSNVVDVGPHLDAATNFPGFNGGEEKHFKVDITNVFYELVIPDIWITPRATNVMVGGSNIQYTVTGTNIPQGVNWSLIPDLSGSGGATIQSNGAWQAAVAPGSIGTNYIIRATSSNNPSFYDQVSLSVVGLQTPLQYKIGTNSWADMPDPLYVCKDSTIDFKAIKVSADSSWPSDKPEWGGGLVSGSGVESNSYTFSTISTNSTDYKEVTAECGNTVTGKVVVIDVQLKLVSYGGSGEYTLRKDGSSWSDDSYTSDGNTNIVDPVWADTNLDGTADISEPACYTRSSSPSLTAVIYVSPTTDISSVSAKLKATSANVPLSYLQDESLSSGDNECNSLTTADTLWNFITNSTVLLSWSISLDEGKTYQVIGQSANSVFVVYDTPSGLITAKRVNWCTSLAAGKNTLDGIGNAIGQDAMSGNRFNSDNSVYQDPATWPWSVMDGTNADCATLSWLMKYELDCVGATDAGVWFVYPRHTNWTGLSSQTVPPLASETNQYGGSLRIWIASGGSCEGLNRYEGCCVFQSKWWMGGEGQSTNSAYSVLRYLADPNTNGNLSLNHQCWHNDTTNYVEYPNGAP
jgi:Tfp pilus assembly protein PilZ